MRICCPHCGERSSAEFAYFGDASLRRPEPRADESTGSQDWMDYVYLRANTPGRHREYWMHANGCRALLVVTRDTSNHDMVCVEAAP